MCQVLGRKAYSFKVLTSTPILPRPAGELRGLSHLTVMAVPVMRWCGRERCALEACGQAFKMQAVDHPERALYNKRPQWAVPEEFIFMQPAFAQCASLSSCTSS